MEVLTALCVIALVAIIACIIANHRDFKDKEYLKVYEKTARNEDTTGDQNFSITVRPNKIRRKHQVTEKEVFIRQAVYYKNFQSKD